MDWPNFFDVMLEGTKDGGSFVFLITTITLSLAYSIILNMWVKKTESEKKRKIYLKDNSSASLSLFFCFVTFICLCAVSLYLPTFLTVIEYKKISIYYLLQFLLGFAPYLIAFQLSKRKFFYKDTNQPVVQR